MARLRATGHHGDRARPSLVRTKAGRVCGEGKSCYREGSSSSAGIEGPHRHGGRASPRDPGRRFGGRDAAGYYNGGGRADGVSGHQEVAHSTTECVCQAAGGRRRHSQAAPSNEGRAPSIGRSCLALQPAREHQCRAVDNEWPHHVERHRSTFFREGASPPIYSLPVTDLSDFVNDYMGSLFGALWQLGVTLQDETSGWPAVLGGAVFEALWNPAADSEDDDQADCHSCGIGSLSGETSSDTRMDSWRNRELYSPGHHHYPGSGCPPDLSDTVSGTLYSSSESGSSSVKNVQLCSGSFPPPLRSCLRLSVPVQDLTRKSVRFAPEVHFWFPAHCQLNFSRDSRVSSSCSSSYGFVQELSGVSGSVHSDGLFSVPLECPPLLWDSSCSSSGGLVTESSSSCAFRPRVLTSSSMPGELSNNPSFSQCPSDGITFDCSPRFPDGLSNNLASDFTGPRVPAYRLSFCSSSHDFIRELSEPPPYEACELELSCAFDAPKRGKLASLEVDVQFGGANRGKGLVIPVGRAPHALVHAGKRSTKAPQLSTSSAAEAKTLASTAASHSTSLPFTSFDAVSGPKALMGQCSWQERDFILRAIEASGLPGTPSGRVLRHPVKDFACPQVALLRGGHPPGRRAIVVDSRFIGGDVHVLEVVPRTLVIEVVRALAARQALGALLDAIRIEAVRVLIDGIPTALNDAVLPQTDVFEFCEGGGPDSSAPFDAASTATTEPFEVVFQQRPSAPPFPSNAITVVRRWKREGANSVAEQAAEVNRVSSRFQRRGMPRCTVYDPLRQVEVVHTTACEELFGLLNWAISRARHLGHMPDGRVINHAIASFPAPQVCIHPPLRADFVAIPVEVSPGFVCTVVSSREASAMDLMSQLERDCSVTRMQRLLLTSGIIRMLINNVAVDDIYERDALIVADSARITPHYVLLEHGVVPEVETIAPHWRQAEGPFVLHRPGLAPIEVHLPMHLSPSGVRHALIAMGYLDNAGSIHTPYVCSAIPGIGAHLLLLSRSHVEAETTFAVHDIRRVVHPPFVPFWTAAVAHQAHLDCLTEILHDAFPVLRPILEVFYDTMPLHEALDHGGCPWLTVMGFPRVTSPQVPVLEPALLPTAELARLRPGYRATYSQYRRSQAAARASTHEQPQTVESIPADNSTCLASLDLTTTTTTAHFADAQDFLSSGCASTTTTSCPPAMQIDATPGCWQTCDIMVHVMGDQAATASTTQSGRGHMAEILTAVVWCLQSNHALSPHSVVTACPRVYFGPDGRCHLFVQARGPATARFLWVFAPEWHATIPWQDSLEFADVLDAVGLLPDDVASVSVDGVLRCEHPAVSRPGSVICVASTRARHFTFPLHLLSDRLLGVQSLLFCASGPGAESLSNRDVLRRFFFELVAEASSCVGEFRRGKRFLVARAGLSPLLCCAGTPLPPTLQQAQSFYDASLRRHFGALRLKDTAQVPHDVSFFVRRHNPREQRVWLLPYEGGADTYLGDLDGRCLADVPAPSGYRIEPSVRSAWCGLARMQPAHRPVEDPVTECLVRLPPGLSSSSDESPTLVHDVRDLTPEEACIIARWEARNQAALGAASQHASSSNEPMALTGDAVVHHVSSSDSGTTPTSSDSSSLDKVDEMTLLQKPIAKCSLANTVDGPSLPSESRGPPLRLHEEACARGAESPLRSACGNKDLQVRPALP